MCCPSSSSSAPPPDPRLVEDALESGRVSRDAIRRITQNAEELAPLQRQQLQFGLDSARTAYSQSQADRQYALGRRRELTGLQDRMVGDAAEYDEAGYANRMAGQAAADVSTAVANARGSQERYLRGRGINMASGAALALGNQLSLGESARRAQAANMARTAAKQEGMRLTDRASNALAGYPAMGMQTTGSGAGFGASGLSLANAGLSGMNSGWGAASNAAGTMGSTATGMYGAMGSYKNGADQVAASNDPFNTILGAAAGVGTKWALGKVG